MARRACLPRLAYYPLTPEIVKTENLIRHPDTAAFLESLLWVADAPHIADWTIHQFHPEFTTALESFLDGFRAFIDLKNEIRETPLDPDDCNRSLGGNVFFSLSGHGCGFWDESDSELGDTLQAWLVEYSGDKYRFQELESTLAKFNGKIHLAYRTAAYRREYLAKLFTPAAPAFPITLIGDPGHKEAQAETVRCLTTRPAWRLADCTHTP